VSLYLDASAILPTLIEESSSQLITRFLTAAEDALAVSEFAAAEVASGLSRLTRMGRLGADAAAGHLADFDFWRAAFTVDIDVQPADIRLTNVFVRRFELGLRAPDALHIAICTRVGDTLVTLDRRLAAAAEALGVRIVMVT
jgi:predicted nucleic acid-binding protein